MEPMIQHVGDTDGGRFFILQDGGESRLVYRRVDTNTVDFLSVRVPEALGGRGLGKALVRHALAWAREANLKVIPTCPFVAAVMRSHPEYRDLWAEESTPGV